MPKFKSSRFLTEEWDKKLLPSESLLPLQNYKSVLRLYCKTSKARQGKGAEGKKYCDATPQIAITFVPRDTSAVRTLWQLHLYFASAVVLYTVLE